MDLKISRKSTDRVPGKTLTFSSYPGTITSGDDFYLISSGLATIETTIGNDNISLWQNVQANKQVPQWTFLLRVWLV